MKIKARHKRKWLLGPATASTFTTGDATLWASLPQAMMADSARDQHTDLVERGGSYLGHRRNVPVHVDRAVTALFTHLYQLPFVAIIELSNNVPGTDVFYLRLVYTKPVTAFDSIQLHTRLALDEFKRAVTA